jgi:hypothetical protein
MNFSKKAQISWADELKKLAWRGAAVLAVTGMADGSWKWFGFALIGLWWVGFQYAAHVLISKNHLDSS